MDPLGFLGGSDSKESACNAGDPGLILGWEDPLEKGMATHFSIPAWRIPWREEPGGLQSMDLQSGTTLSEQLTLSNGLSSCGSRVLEHRDSVVVECRLNCSGASGLLIPHQGLNPSPLHCKADS